MLADSTPVSHLSANSVTDTADKPQALFRQAPPDPTLDNPVESYPRLLCSTLIIVDIAGTERTRSRRWPMKSFVTNRRREGCQPRFHDYPTKIMYVNLRSEAGQIQKWRFQKMLALNLFIKFAQKNG
jgi:hypothetical protein